MKVWVRPRHWFVPQLRKFDKRWFRKEEYWKETHLYCMRCGEHITSPTHFTVEEKENENAGTS